MPSLAAMMKGQVKLKRGLLQHLGIKPGERIEFDKLPGGELLVKAASSSLREFDPALAGHLDRASAQLRIPIPSPLPIFPPEWPARLQTLSGRGRAWHPVRC